MLTMLFAKIQSLLTHSLYCSHLFNQAHSNTLIVPCTFTFIDLRIVFTDTLYQSEN